MGCGASSDSGKPSKATAPSAPTPNNNSLILEKPISDAASFNQRKIEQRNALKNRTAKNTSSADCDSGDTAGTTPSSAAMIGPRRDLSFALSRNSSTGRTRLEECNACASRRTEEHTIGHWLDDIAISRAACSTSTNNPLNHLGDGHAHLSSSMQSQISTSRHGTDNLFVHPLVAICHRPRGSSGVQPPHNRRESSNIFDHYDLMVSEDDADDDNAGTPSRKKSSMVIVSSGGSTMRQISLAIASEHTLASTTTPSALSLASFPGIEDMLLTGGDSGGNIMAEHVTAEETELVQRLVDSHRSISNRESPCVSDQDNDPDEEEDLPHKTPKSPSAKRYRARMIHHFKSPREAEGEILADEKKVFGWGDDDNDDFL